MSQTYNPNSFAPDLPIPQRQWTQDMQKVVNGGIEIGVAVQNSPTAPSGVNAGLPTQYQQANGSGIMIRVAAAGDTTSGASYNWNGNNTGIQIKHGLMRAPIGFHVVDQDGQVSVYRTAPSDENYITLAPTDQTKNVTVYIF